jgi:prolyl-tRNA synthetase
MKSTQLFTRTRKEAPADEQSKNAQLLIRAGFVHKEMAGVYTFLPLGKRVLENIIQIIREEMDAIGGNEISMTALQQKDVWEASGRWSDDVMDVWFRTTLANGAELGLAPTHEEPLTALMKNFIDSYKDLPSYPYQFQIKFRNELRSKSGLMRGREFVMKDLYSFSRDQKEHDAFYEKCAQAYKAVFDRLGIGDITYRTFASGGSFSKFSDEFQTISDVGEDTIYIHEGKGIALNQEVYTDEVMTDLGIKKEDLVEKTAVEVGNIFTLGTKFSDALDLTYTAEDGSKQAVFMGSYGIGPSRLVGLLAEHFADEKGLVWPESVAPFQIYLAPLGASEAVLHAADDLYQTMQQKGLEVLYDDRDVRAGEKFADADLTGIPHRVVISEKTLANGNVEYKHRTKKDADLMTTKALLELLAKP